jgi:hypothetical protein
VNSKRERMPAVAVPPRYRDLPVSLTGAPTARSLLDPLFFGHRGRPAGGTGLAASVFQVACAGPGILLDVPGAPSLGVSGGQSPPAEPTPITPADPLTVF